MQKKSVILAVFIFSLILVMPLASAQNETNATTCTDSDGGKNYYISGTACINGECTSDVCVADSLNEAYCKDNKVYVETYSCSDGCSEGACLAQVCPTIIGWRIENEKCVSDSGCAYDSSKYVYYDTEEICIKTLKENVQETETKPISEPVPTACAAKISISFDKQIYYVGDKFKIAIETFDSQGNHLPDYGFFIQMYNYDSGAWNTFKDDKTDGGGYRTHEGEIQIGEPLQTGKNMLKVFTKAAGCNLVEDIITIEIKRKEWEPIPEPVPCGMGSCVPAPEPIVEPIDIPEEKGFYSCMGCEKDGKCYPMGYRKEGNYCSDNYEFAAQLEAGECDNNFECKGNVCIGGECLTEGFIEKLIEWIKSLLGVEPKPPVEKACSKLLLEHNIGEYKYAESKYGGDKHTQVALFSEDGKYLETIKCCDATYKDEGDIKYETLICSFDSKEEITNSVKWIIAKERNIVLGEYKDYKVFGDEEGKIIAWTSNSYLIVVGSEPSDKPTPLPEDIADAYLKKYPSDFSLTEDDIPDAPPEQPWVYCTEEDEKAGKECQASGGALQTDPHPDKEKNCEVYKGCALHREACEEITNINDKEDCYVRIAAKTGDISMCEKITDASKKEKCLGLTSAQEPVIAEKEFLAEIKSLGLGEATLIDFETLPDGTTPKNGDRVTGKEWEGLGVTFEFPSENYLQLFGPMYPFNPLGKLSLSPGLGPFEAGGDTHDDLNIIFSKPVKAAGIYLMDLGGTDERESITFLDKNNNVIKRISPWPSPTFGNPAPGTFVSLIHEEGISKIEILENTGDSDDIAYDNLYFVE